MCVYARVGCVSVRVCAHVCKCECACVACAWRGGVDDDGSKEFVFILYLNVQEFFTDEFSLVPFSFIRDNLQCRIVQGQWH